MRVRVVKVNQAQGGTATLSFESSLGKATALWVGKPPLQGLEYEVEIEVPGVLVWGTEISATSSQESIYEEDGRVFLVGRVQSLSDDGVAAIRLGGDTVLIEIADAPLEISMKVAICVPQIKFFDVNL